MNRYVYILLLLLAAVLWPSCRKTIGPTEIGVVDSVRHYYPVVQGVDVRMSYRIYNAGSRPLVIADILPSCSMIELVGELPHLIPRRDSADLNMIFHTDKNIGYAEHKVRLYGNFNDGTCTLRFDVNIVRPSLDRSDYEEIYFARLAATMEEAVDGKMGEKGYYTDEDMQEWTNDMEEWVKKDK